MQIPLGALAAMLSGKLSDPARAGTIVDDVRALDVAGPTHLAFLWDPAFAEAALASRAAAIVCEAPLAGVTCIVVADAQRAMLALLGQVYAQRHPRPPAGVHPTAVVDPTATLGEAVSLGPHVVVEAGARLGARVVVRAGAYVGRGVTIGDDSVVQPHATLLDHCVLGARVVVWSGAIVGKDGFGFVPRSGDRRDLSRGSARIPQIGGVRIGDDVEVGALTTVARGALEDTVIEDGVIVDDQVHVAHGCRVGKNSVVVGRTALSGAAVIGEGTYLLQGSAVGQGRRVGDRAIVGSGAQVLYKDVGAGEEVLGWPARPAMRERRLQVTLDRLVDELPELRRRVKALERALEARDRSA